MLFHLENEQLLAENEELKEAVAVLSQSKVCIYVCIQMKCIMVHMYVRMYVCRSKDEMRVCLPPGIFMNRTHLCS